MKFMKVSDEAYREFKDFLVSSNVEDYNLRIKYLGTNCSGPIFNVYSGKEEENDVIDTVNDINFIVDREIINSFGGFIILSSRESSKMGLELKPFIEPPSGCGGCSKCNC